MRTRELEQILMSIGFILVRSNKHKVWARGTERTFTSFSKDMAKCTALRVLRQVGYKYD